MHETYRGVTHKIFLSFYALCRLTAAAAAALQQHHAKTKNCDKKTKIIKMTFLSLLTRFFLQFQLIYSSLYFKKFILKNLRKNYNFCHFIPVFGFGMMLLQHSCSCSCESAKCIKTQEYLKSNSPISFMHVACL